ncbi:hypothetical protein FOMG_19407 [Fusarium oxysporum f. sp. melonis 26406]|uniref:Uncharacterized protein n=1 Tax=Fusarium oxysporum f. sp. melonis 26406 TaxID=1089452 RepID=W9YW96_FUSOX|nr:hypothetical protein FOMG_19407 [Fusarium oxysporum f. sp. melonis 26406]
MDYLPVCDRDRCIRTKMTSDADISTNHGECSLLFIKCENSSLRVKTQSHNHTAPLS